MSVNAQDSVPDYGGSIGYGIFHLLIKLIGLTPAYLLLALILPYYLILRTRVRRSAYYYLKRRFPGQSRVKRFIVASYYMHQFGKVLIDQAAMGIVGKDKFCVDFPEKEKLYELAKKKRGMVLLTTHAGNWQTAMAMMDNIDTRVNLLFDLKNQDGKHFFDLSGQRNHFHFIPPDGFLGGMVEATNALKAGEIVAIMGDRAFGAKIRGMKFLGQEAQFPVTPYHLAYATGADIVTLLTVRTGKLAFAIKAVCISDGIDRTKTGRDEAVKIFLNRYVSHVENYLQKNPYMWFNFFNFWNTGKNIRGESRIVSRK